MKKRTLRVTGVESPVKQANVNFHSSLRFLANIHGASFTLSGEFAVSPATHLLIRSVSTRSSSVRFRCAYLDDDEGHVIDRFGVAAKCREVFANGAGDVVGRAGSRFPNHRA